MTKYNSDTEIHCDLCDSLLALQNTFFVSCGCPNGSLVCHRCKSIAGQGYCQISGCCINCYRRATRYSIDNKYVPPPCMHVQTQKCCHCHQKIRMFSSSIVEAQSLQIIRFAWERLKCNRSLVRRSCFFAMMAENWGMFSQFFCQNFCITMRENPWTQPKKLAFFQLWLLSQMNNPVGPRIDMSILSNLWESYPRSPLFISSQFSWRFRRFPWVRKLISKLAVSWDSRCDASQLFRQSYLYRYRCIKHRMMIFIIRYLMSQHAEIFSVL